MQPVLCNGVKVASVMDGVVEGSLVARAIDQVVAKD